MDVRTFRAASMQEALTKVRFELGPEAAVLHTREVHSGRWSRWFGGRRQIEITASTQVAVPSRFPAEVAEPAPVAKPVSASPPAPHFDMVSSAPQDPGVDHDSLQQQLGQLQSMVDDLRRRSQKDHGHDWPQELFELYTDLIEAEVTEDLARELIERLRADAPAEEVTDRTLDKARISSMIEDEISVAGPIICREGECRVVAMVGPTGVGKTTTIAKLAANFRLREKKRVALVTVDTYRIAAVDQLRTYADIIDLPLHVVSTPREMRSAIEQLQDYDLILIDTAGRSPRDGVKLQELKAFLAEARTDDIHLVLSSVNSAKSLARTAEDFSAVGTTALVLTKLDEASSLGNLLPLLRSSKLPLSYLTNGQNVPDDIEPAERRRLARVVLGIETD